MGDGSVWILVLIVGVMMVGLVAFARGLEHARGPQQVSVVVVSDETEPAPAPAPTADPSE